MGQPVSEAGTLQDWTKQDLAAFIRTHVVNILPEIAPNLGSPNVHVQGQLYLSPDTRIRSRDMEAPTLVAGSGGPGFQNACTDSPTAGVSKVQFFIDPFRWVHLRGTARVPAPGTAIVFALPPGYRPDKLATLGAAVYDPVGAAWVGVRALVIGTDGTIACPNITFGNAVDIHFDGIRFPLVTNN